jgi:hypothetical protein
MIETDLIKEDEMKEEELVDVVNSGHVTKVGYNEEKQEFVAYFGDRGYKYFKVPMHDGRIIVATAGMEDISTGHWINELIKKGNYDFEEI